MGKGGVAKLGVRYRYGGLMQVLIIYELAVCILVLGAIYTVTYSVAVSWTCALAF